VQEDRIGGILARYGKEAGLLKPSVLKPLLATIEKGLVLRKLGRLGEEDRQVLSRALDDILGEIAEFHEVQLQNTIKRFSAIVEPLVIIVVGGIVGFVYISFFMALFAAAGGG